MKEASTPVVISEGEFTFLFCWQIQIYSKSRDTYNNVKGPWLHHDIVHDFQLGEIERLRRAGVCLPHSNTVKAHRKYGMSTSGWNRELIEEMKSVYNKDGIERGRHGIISFDEVKIKEGLIYDPHGGSLIGENSRDKYIP